MKNARFFVPLLMVLALLALAGAVYRTAHHLWRLARLQQGEQAARSADPMAHLAALKNIPILLMHGDADATVPAAANSQRVAAQLPTIYHVIAGGGHGDPRCFDAAVIVNFVRHSVPVGAPVICLHACGGTAQDWGASASPDRAKVALALQRAGYPMFADSYGDTWGNDRAVAQLDRLVGTRRVVLLGESMGGALALRYAEAHPAKTAAIIGIYPVCSLTDMMSRPTLLAEGIRASYAP